MVSFRCYYFEKEATLSVNRLYPEGYKTFAEDDVEALINPYDSSILKMIKLFPIDEELHPNTIFLDTENKVKIGEAIWGEFYEYSLPGKTMNKTVASLF